MNIVADIGNSQIKIAIERKKGISKVKAFRSDDFINIKKYLKSLDCDNKPYFVVPSSRCSLIIRGYNNRTLIFDVFIFIEVIR